jgi:hypothetical protein
LQRDRYCTKQRCARRQTDYGQLSHWALLKWEQQAIDLSTQPAAIKLLPIRSGYQLIEGVPDRSTGWLQI